MTEAEKLEMLQEAESITRGMREVIYSGPKDMLQAMFEFTKISARADKWVEKYKKFEKRDYRAKLEGKESGWEVAAMQRLLASAYSIFKDREELTLAPGGADYSQIFARMYGWMTMYEQQGWKAEEYEESHP